MKVHPEEGGTWCVMRGEEVVASGLTNSQAWRMADVASNEHLSKAEATSDWVAATSAVNALSRQYPILTESDIAQRLAAAEAGYQEYVASDDLEYDNWYGREAGRLRDLLALIRLGLSVQETNRPGIYLVNNFYEVAPRKRRWRQIKKPTWYRYKSPAQFKEQFVDARAK